MRFIRYIEEGKPRFGWVNEEAVGPVEGIPFGDYRRLETNTPLNQVQLLPPIIPSKIIGINNNYDISPQGTNEDLTEVPLLFMKPPSSFIGHKDTIIIPPQAPNIAVAAHLAVVIGKKARWVQVESAKTHILGYMICNDITADDLERRDRSWVRSKGFDTFCPAGPWIQTNFNDLDSQISCSVNGEVRQMASTHEMVFTINQLIAYISSIMTLYPGDVILSGSPGAASRLVAGDIIESNIEGIGTLKNQVANRIE